MENRVGCPKLSFTLDEIYHSFLCAQFNVSCSDFYKKSPEEKLLFVKESLLQNNLVIVEDPKATRSEQQYFLYATQNKKENPCLSTVL